MINILEYSPNKNVHLDELGRGGGDDELGEGRVHGDGNALRTQGPRNAVGSDVELRDKGQGGVLEGVPRRRPDLRTQELQRIEGSQTQFLFGNEV